MLAQPAIDTPFRPLEAISAVRRLLSSPENTTEVFVVLEALRGRSGLRSFRRFSASPTGAAILTERRRLLPRLQDLPGLRALPAESLGGAYLEFMCEQNLSADGLIEASQVARTSPRTAEIEIFRDRMRDMHDLTHVLTGYGRDPLGELCLLAFSFAHHGNLGMALIVVMGMGRFTRGPEGAMARAAIVEAWRHGRKAQWLLDLDWEQMLAEPVADLRQRLKIAEPTAYLRAAP